VSDVCSMMRDCVVVDVYTSSDVQFIIIIINVKKTVVL